MVCLRGPCRASETGRRPHVHALTHSFPTFKEKAVAMAFWALVILARLCAVNAKVCKASQSVVCC